ncbi:MAG: VWA domain-containing protein [Acidobacteriia bacterium]|nr:VWA domain-containing protein [Terriglobia bacterium]
MRLPGTKFQLFLPLALLAATAFLLPTLASQDRARLRSQVNLVNVLVSVTDEHHRPVANLTREQFALEEEGRAQKIEIFEPETQLPLDLALMIDASLSTQKEMAVEREAASRFIRQVLRPGDGLSLFEFDETVRQLAHFSDDPAYLQESLGRIAPGAGTSLYDAIVLGSRALENRAGDRRRVILLVTDAGETTSHYDFDGARTAALQAGALLYTIVVRPSPGESGRNTAGEHALEAITDTTGGAIFIPDALQELPAIFSTIDRELRTQYRLAYYPAPRGRAGSFRAIEVKVPEKYEARHRKGYFAGPD